MCNGTTQEYYLVINVLRAFFFFSFNIRCTRHTRHHCSSILPLPLPSFPLHFIIITFPLPFPLLETTPPRPRRVIKAPMLILGTSSMFPFLSTARPKPVFRTCWIHVIDSGQPTCVDAWVVMAGCGVVFAGLVLLEAGTASFGGLGGGGWARG